MSIFGQALADAGVGLLGGLFSAKGARDRNKVQRQMAREQMAFQERMSSTAYQRAAQDLEKAGLNRILALGKPASTPGGAMANIVDELTPAVASAAQLRRNNAEMRQVREATELAKEQQENVYAQTQKTANENISAWVKKNMDVEAWKAFEKHPWAKEAHLLSQAVAPQVGTAFAIKEMFSGGEIKDFLKNIWFGDSK